jgi:hypothetical protein
MRVSEIVAVYSENRIKHIFHGQNVVMLMLKQMIYILSTVL